MSAVPSGPQRPTREIPGEREADPTVTRSLTLYLIKELLHNLRTRTRH